MTVTATQRPDTYPPAQTVADGEGRYAGLATRSVAFLIDAVVVYVVAVVVAAAAALIVSFFNPPDDVDTILKWIGVGLAVLWAITYFVAFWSATGQTPGNRLMQIRVVTATGERVKPRRGVLRCLGLVLAALPLFAGYLLILFDRQRRGFQDRFAGTVVIEAPDLSLAEAKRMRKRQARQATRGGSATALPEVDEVPVAERAERVSVTR